MYKRQVVIPEGLIEFIHSIGRLIGELNDLLAAHGADYKDLDKDAQRKYILEHLSEANRSTFETLPEDVARQLSLDRDPHGNVQVSLIETEKLLSNMVAAKLEQWKMCIRDRFNLFHQRIAGGICKDISPVFIRYQNMCSIRFGIGSCHARRQRKSCADLRLKELMSLL